MSERTGPEIVRTYSCRGCTLLRSKYYYVEDGIDMDWGFTYWCANTEPPTPLSASSNTGAPPSVCVYQIRPKPTPQRLTEIREMASTLQWGRDADAADAMNELLQALGEDRDG
jgi:hypothetical protein